MASAVAAAASKLLEAYPAVKVAGSVQVVAEASKLAGFDRRAGSGTLQEQQHFATSVAQTNSSSKAAAAEPYSAAAEEPSSAAERYSKQPVVDAVAVTLAWLHAAVAVKIRAHSELVAVVPVVADTCCSVEPAVELLELPTSAERRISAEPAVELAAVVAEMLAAEAEPERSHRHSAVVAGQRRCYYSDLVVVMMTRVEHFGRQSCWREVVVDS